MKTAFTTIIGITLLACGFALAGGSDAGYMGSNKAIGPQIPPTMSLFDTGTVLNGVDVSVYQGTINWDTLKTATNFAIIRSSYGCPDPGETVAQYTDSKLARNQSESRRVGMLHGYYHYSYPQYNTATCEANQFLNAIGTLQAGEVLCLDFEESYSDPVTWCKAFLDAVKTRTGLKAFLYINYANVLAHDWSPVYNAGYPLWLADWDGISTAGIPNTPWTPAWVIKQYTGGAVGGISGNTDIDIFNGDSAAWQALGGLTASGTISGKISNPLNVGISGASVSTSPGTYTATTASDGTYSMTGVTPGSYTVTASASGYTTQTSSSFNVTANNTSTVNLTLPDATAPGAPTVTDDGAYQTSNTSLHFSWTASDAQSGIAAYQYAISTDTTTANIIPGGGWVNVGTAAQATRTGITLANGGYYVGLVKAQNGSGLWSAIGTSDGIRVAKAESTIAQAKAEAENTMVALNQKVVVASLPTSIYIEEGDQSSGIMVTAFGFAENTLVNLAGYLYTTGGEREITCYAISSVGTATMPRPVAFPNAFLGGAPLNSLTPGVTGGTGANNVGLLVTTWGYVTSIQTGYFMMSDKTGAAFKVTIPSGVTVPGLTVGNFVILTGISSSDSGVRMIKIRKAADVAIKS